MEQFPATTRVAEGQFAFVPDAEQIQAWVDKRWDGYVSRDPEAVKV